ncbi:MAG: hypothetical protein ACRCYO_06670 [Bacteroidia bacterium]
MNRLITMFLLGALLLLVSCERAVAVLGPEEYIRWVESKENGLYQEKTIGEIRYTVQYRPLDYVRLSEVENGDYAAAMKTHATDRMQYYLLRVGKANGQGDVLVDGVQVDDAFHQKNAYLMFDFQQDLVLYQNGDTLHPKLYHYQNYQGLAPYVEMLIGFECQQAQMQTDRTFVVDDQVWESGLLKFEFEGSVIQSTPKVETH